MSIKILSRKELNKFVNSDEGKGYHVIIITGIDEKYLVPEIKAAATGEVLDLEFTDIEFDSPEIRTRYSPPEKQHVQKALEWAIEKENIAIACMAGVSRSSAIAFAIETCRHGPWQAESVLVKGQHRPNKLIVKYAAELLGEPEMIDVADQYRDYTDPA